ncbi:cutinase family protein [Nocardia sp. NPDC048505]|uniref:cutinase family protein n=1 Tax=Nocardia sp. NPDC048505 TaxID=3155756 RepID=UPI003410D3B6
MNARRGSSPRRSRPVGCLIFLAVVALLVAIVLLIWSIAAGWWKPPGPTKPPEETPKTQPESCPDVQFISIPGTWESNADDDPYHPTANPVSLMLNISKPLQEQFPGSRLDVYTVPYVAQFSNPVAIPPDGQTSYNLSRAEGEQRTLDFMIGRQKECPLTNYVLAGFSQGAVIAGDVAARIGAGDGPVSADRVLGVTLLADGRREPGDGQATLIGTAPPGVGAEVALRGLKVPGITMTGARPGFGKLADRTFTICAPGDMICDSPKQALNPANFIPSVLTLVRAAGNPVHSLYNGYVVDPATGATATQWTVGWAAGLVNNAPHPPHS